MKQEDIEMEKINNYLRMYDSIADFYMGERENLSDVVRKNNYEYISPDEENSMLRMIVYEEDMQKLKSKVSSALPLEVMPGEEEIFLQRFYDYFGVPDNFDILSQKFAEKDFSYYRKLK